ncbi:TPA: hypothetical protein U1B40_001610 [Streptococcus suis]|uniref:hypothetical protein n=1 Tax=Streptococcus suis TaxID=1307 RepID=UPI00145B82C6|nr:hypothetical protein [Streptococcus suis]MBM7137806.1 hypothetical protein [Streptococcus suis]MBM7318003.1 hypothetical protein [Streptococcus suis]MBY4600588.1 hypothetical protein [Streptococcus suis]MBY4963902.1 hypothetical protein [Streptococcus suis]MCO8172644.1 hypothetical protein [Streptococcus suis]
MTPLEERYYMERRAFLGQQATRQELLDRVIYLELMVMDMADSTLDTDFPEMAVNTTLDHIANFGDEALYLLESLDHDGDYKALWEHTKDTGADNGK